MIARLYRFLFGTLRGRLILSVALVHAVLMTLLIVDLTARQREILLDRQMEEATSLSRSLATSGAGWIAAQDVAGLQELVEATRRYPGVLFAVMTDAQGRVLADTDPRRLGLFLLDLPGEPEVAMLSRSGALVDVVTPAMAGERHVGWARVGVAQQATGEKLAEITRSGVIYALAAIVVGSIAAWVMGRRITRRLFAVQRTMDAVRAGRTHARAMVAGEDEAAAIAREFNAMLDALAERDAELRASEQRYRSLIVKVQAGIVLHDGTGALLTCNPMAEALLGRSLAELTGKAPADPDWHFLHEDGSILPVTEYPVFRVLAERVPLRGVVAGIRRRGRDDIAWVLVNAEPEYAEDGSIALVIVSFVDVSERKRAAEALRAGEERYRLVFENSPVSLWEEDFSAVKGTLDRLREAGVSDIATHLSVHPEVVVRCAELVRIVDVNRAALTLHGAASKEELLTGLVRTFTPESFDAFREELIGLWNGATEMSRDAVVKTFAGERRDVTVHFSVCPGFEASLGRVVISLTDITEAKRVERERLANLHFFESMDRINLALQGSGPLEQVMGDLLDAVLAVFDCDRAFLTYPCDPQAPSWRVPFERTRPAWPGAGALNQAIPTDPDVARISRLLLAADGPLKFDAATEAAATHAIAPAFGIRSLMAMAVRPKGDTPWQFGIHQCSYDRVWSDAEEKLFREIGRRVEDALGSLLSHRALEASETRYRRIVDTAAEGIWAVGPDLLTTFINARMAEILGCSIEEVIGRPMTHFIVEEELPDHQEKVQRRRKGISEGYERRFRRKDGRIVWTQVSASALSDDHGNFIGSFAMLTEITERKQAELALLRLNRELRAISDCNQVLVRAVDEQSLIDDICRIVCDKAGYQVAWVAYAAEEAADSLRIVAWAGPGGALPPQAGWAGALRPERRVEIDEMAADPEAAPWSAAVRARGYQACIYLPLQDAQARTFGVLGIYSTEADAFTEQERRLLGELASDLAFGIVALRVRAERDAAQEEMRIAATAFEAQEGILITDAAEVILRVNRAFCEITGYRSEEVVGLTPRVLASGRQDAGFYHDMWQRIAAEGFWQGEVWNRRKSGAIYPEWLNITAVKNLRGEVTHYVGTLSDITERKEAEKKIEHLAFYDLLTELPNRRLLMDRLQQAVAGLARSRRMGALLFIDLDNFKIVNDTAGHDVGDQLLINVAQRLKSCVRDGDTIARLGGDEFVVMLEDLSDTPPLAAAQVERVAEKIKLLLNEPHAIGGHLFHSTPSIGAALFGGGGRSSSEELLKQADIAMYQAKAGGRNTLRFFDPQMQAVLATRAEMEGALRQAVQRGEFVLYYQPQVESAGRIIGAEALLRWVRQDNGIVAPDEFIPVAEETGLILEIGRWVLESACAQLHAWSQRPHTRDLYIAVNVSARQFRQEGFVAQVQQALTQAGAPAQRLKLELTESLVLDDVEDTIEKLHALKALGVGFSMDDFGTGYSSLSYLTRLPLDQLKIDRSFVQNLPGSANDAVVVQTILTLAVSLGLATVAEGVETEAQREFLARHGCPVYQGYLFSRPVPLPVLEEMVDGPAPSCGINMG